MDMSIKVEDRRRKGHGLERLIWFLARGLNHVTTLALSNPFLFLCASEYRTTTLTPCNRLDEHISF